MAVSAMIPLLMLVISAFGVSRDYSIWREPQVDRLARRLALLRDLEDSLTPRAGAESTAFAVGRFLSPRRSVKYSAAEIDAFRLHVGDQFATTIADERTWQLLSSTSAPLVRELRAVADRAAAQTRSATEIERRAAATTARSIIDREARREAGRPGFVVLQLGVMLRLQLGIALAIGFVSMVLAAVFCGPPILRLFGFGIAGLAVLASRDASIRVTTGVSLVMGAIWCAGIVWACVQPARGLHDKLARTRIVPL
jgi:hypothetical protein